MNYRHGHCCKNGERRHSRIYLVWRAMINRCHNPNDWSYQRYGGRGIAVCAEWQGKQGFANFLKDMGDAPLMQLDRIDNNAGYSKSNCRWTTRIEQCSNRRDNRFITLKGEKLTVSEAARRIGIGQSTILWRLNRGWDENKALFTPIANGRDQFGRFAVVLKKT